MAVDRLTACCLETLAVGSAVFAFGRAVDSDGEAMARTVSTGLLSAPSPPAVASQAERLLSSLHGQKADYLAHRDACVVDRAMSQLDAMVTGRRLASVATAMMPDTPQDFDVEVFQELLAQVRRIALARPKHLPSDNQLYERLVHVFEQRLLGSRSKDTATSPLHRPSISELEATVAALVEVLHARLLLLLEEAGEEDTDSGKGVSWIADVLTRLVVHEDLQVSSAARGALCRLTKLPKPPVPAPTAAAATADVETGEREDDTAKEIVSGTSMAAPLEEFCAVRCAALFHENFIVPFSWRPRWRGGPQQQQSPSDGAAWQLPSGTLECGRGASRGWCASSRRFQPNSRLRWP